MKKRNSLAVLLLAGAGVLGVSSCDLLGGNPGGNKPGEQQTQTHSHVFVTHEAVAATCLQTGMAAHKTCSECGKYFNMQDEEVTQASLVTEKLSHDPEHHNAVPATCVADGTGEYWTCKNEGDDNKYSDAQCTTVISSIPKEDAKGHHTTKVDGKAASCSEDGWEDYYECECGDLFEDAEATEPIANLEAWKVGDGKIAKGEHNYGTPEVVWTGNSAHAVAKCTGCTATIEETKVGTFVGDTQATCHSPQTGHYEVTFTDTRLGSASTDANSAEGAPATGEHTYGTVEVSWSGSSATATKTCTSNGCTASISETKVGTFVEDTAVTCHSAQKGHYEVEFNDSRLGSASTEPNSAEGAPATGEHTYGTAQVSWNGNSATATATCTAEGCDAYITETKEGTFVKDTAETCTEPQKGHYEVTFNDSRLGSASTTANSVENGDPHAHSFGVLTPRVEAVRENDGNIAYYQCSECNGYFNEEHESISAESIVIPAPAQHFDAAANLTINFDPIATTETIYVDIKFVGAQADSKINISLLGTKDGGGNDWDNYLGYFELCEKSVASNAGISADTITDDGWFRIKIDMNAITKVSGVKPASVNALYVRGNWSNVEGYIEVNSLVKDHQGFGTWIEQVDPYHDVAGVKAHYECTGCNHHFDASYKMFDSRIAPSAFHYDPTHDPTLFYGALETPAALDHEIALFDVKFDDPDTHQEIGFSMYDGSWADHTAVYWLDCDSNGVYFEGVYDGISVHMMEDGYYRVFADLARIDPKACAQITHLYIQFPNTASNRGSGYLDVLPTYDDADKVSEGELFNKYKADSRIYIEPTSAENELVYVDVKFFSEDTADHINVGYYQDDSNYFGTYTMQANGQGDVKTMYDLGNGYYRFIYDLTGKTWKKTGSPETINYIQINQKWSTSNALVKAGRLPFNDIYVGGEDYSKTLAESVNIATGTIDLEVKYQSGADSKISFRLDQDDSNFIFNYDLTPAIKTGDKAGITVTELGDNTFKYSFKLSELTNTPTGSPTIINKVRIRGAWSTGFGYLNVFYDVGNNWQDLKGGDFVSLPKEYVSEEIFGKALSFNFKLEASDTLTHSDYAHVVIMNEEDGWQNLSGEIDLFGDYTANKDGFVTSLGDGWYNVHIDTAKFNGNGSVRTVASKLYVSKLEGNITKVTIDWDSFGFVDFERSIDTSKAGENLAKLLNGISNWKSSGKQITIECEETGDRGGHKNIFLLVNGSGTALAKFTIRPNTHVLKDGDDGNDIGTVTQVSGEVYRYTFDLSELTALDDGSGTVTALQILSMWSTMNVSSVTIA